MADETKTAQKNHKASRQKNISHRSCAKDRHYLYRLPLLRKTTPSPRKPTGPGRPRRQGALSPPPLQPRQDIVRHCRHRRNCSGGSIGKGGMLSPSSMSSWPPRPFSPFPDTAPCRNLQHVAPVRHECSRFAVLHNKRCPDSRRPFPAPSGSPPPNDQGVDAEKTPSPATDQPFSPRPSRPARRLRPPAGVGWAPKPFATQPVTADRQGSRTPRHDRDGAVAIDLVFSSPDLLGWDPVQGTSIRRPTKQH